MEHLLPESRGQTCAFRPVCNCPWWNLWATMAFFQQHHLCAGREALLWGTSFGMRPFKFIVLLGALLPFFGMALPFVVFDLGYQDTEVLHAEVSAEDLRAASIEVDILIEDDAEPAMLAVKYELEREVENFHREVKEDPNIQRGFTVISWIPYLVSMVLVLVCLLGIRRFGRGLAMTAVFFSSLGTVAHFMSRDALDTFESDIRREIVGDLARSASGVASDFAFSLDFGMGIDLVFYGTVIALVGGLLASVFPERRSTGSAPDEPKGGKKNEEPAEEVPPLEVIESPAPETQEETPETQEETPETQEETPETQEETPETQEETPEDEDSPDLSNVVGLGAGPKARYLPVIVPEDE
jgi:hypothetical protein